MTDQVPEGGQVIAEGQLAKPTFTEPPVDKPPFEPAKPDAQFDEGQFLAKVDSLLDRKLQGLKDQRVDKLQKQLGIDPRQIVADIKGGKDPDKVLEDYERQSLFDRLDAIENKVSAPSEPSQNGKSEADEAFERAVGLVQKAGLANDPEVAGMFGEKYKTPSDFLFAVSEKVLSRNTQKQPSAASASSPSGGGKQVASAESVQAEIDNLLSSREVTTVEGRAKLKELRQQLGESAE